MKWSPSKFRQSLEKEVNTFNKSAAAALCQRLIEHLSARPGAYPEDEALGDATYKVKKLLWTSAPSVLDASVVELDKPVKKSDLYPLADLLPVVNPEARVYIIGHPGGGELAYSIQDNLLLDHQDPPGFIHYRTPTKPGSSGSPVFNRAWDLIGLHHAGAPRPKLNKKKGTYEANEGIWIKAIIRAIAESFGDDRDEE